MGYTWVTHSDNTFILITFLRTLELTPSPHQCPQAETGVLGPVQPQLAEAHVAQASGQLWLQVDGPDILQAAQSQAIQEDKRGTQSGEVASGS